MQEREVTPDYMSISEAFSGSAPLIGMDPRPDYEDDEGHVNTAFEEDNDITNAPYPQQLEENLPGQPMITTTSTATTTAAATTTTTAPTYIPTTDTALPVDPSNGSSTSTVLDISQVETLVEHRAEQNGSQSRMELLYRMSMAHLAPKGVNWSQEINKATEMEESSEIPAQVLNALRGFPMGMSEKLSLNNWLRNQSDVRYSQFGLSMGSLGQHGNTTMARGQKAVGDILYSDTFGTLGFWDKPIAKISALLGTNVASYFKFLRFLAVLNTWSAIIMFGFVAIPQIVPDDLINDDIKRGFFGKLSQTIFFYGAYSNVSIEKTVAGADLTYDRPLSYFLTWCSIYVLTILFIVMIMYTTYRRSKQTFGDARGRYSTALLIGWDHSVTNKEGCRLKASALTTYFREMKLEDVKKTKLSRCDKCALWMVRGVCTFLCVAIMGGSGYLIYFVADMSMGYVGLQPSNFQDFFKKYRLTVMVTALKILIPPVLSLLLYFENWQPRTSIKIQLARTAVFYGASLMTFLISVYTMSTQCVGRAKAHNSTGISKTTSSSPLLPAISLKYQRTDYCCWENDVGEQLFQVVILDLLVNIGVGLLLMAGRALVVQKSFRFRKLGNAEFNVAAEILDLVYGQALIWLGLYFAPFLALFGSLKLIIQFYFFYNMAARFCDPPTSIFRASRSGGFFRFVLLVTLFLCMFPLTYMIVSIEPSSSCGPFKTNDRIFQVFTNTIGESPDWLRTILFYITTPAVVIPVFVLLLLLVFYYRVKSATQKKSAKKIRVQFKMKRQLEKKQLFSKNRLQRGMTRYERNRNQRLISTDETILY